MFSFLSLLLELLRFCCCLGFSFGFCFFVCLFVCFVCLVGVLLGFFVCCVLVVLFVCLALWFGLVFCGVGRTGQGGSPQN